MWLGMGLSRSQCRIGQLGKFAKWSVWLGSGRVGERMLGKRDQDGEVSDKEYEDFKEIWVTGESDTSLELYNCCVVTCY